jgi:hypothetical protein
MKSYLTEWKKFKNQVLSEDVQAAQDSLKTAQEKQKKIIDYAEMMKKQAQQEVSQAQAEVVAAQAAENSEKQQDKMQQAAQPATSSTIGSSPLKTENAAGERDEGTVGQQPVSVQEELTELEEEEACGDYEGVDEAGNSCKVTLEYDEVEEEKACNECRYCKTDKLITEAKYKGRTVALGKPMRGDVKKFKVFVRDPKTGNVKKVNFGDKKMRIKKSNPKRRKSFRARHRCANPGPRTKARYWSCRKW